MKHRTNTHVPEWKGIDDELAIRPRAHAVRSQLPVSFEGFGKLSQARDNGHPGEELLPDAAAIAAVGPASDLRSFFVGVKRGAQAGTEELGTLLWGGGRPHGLVGVEGVKDDVEVGQRCWGVRGWGCCVGWVTTLMWWCMPCVPEG